MMSATAGMVVPEKRKRGRPRKNPPVPAPPITASAPVMLSPPPVAQEANISMMQQQMHSQGMPPQQYLLAVFALFSFFKSPLASSMSAQHTHTHSGSVLSDVTVKLPTSSILSSEQWTWNNFVQVVHLVVSLLVFATIVFPWLPLPRGLRHTRLMRLVSFGTASRDTRGSARGGFTTHISSTDALPTPPASPSASDTESDTDSSSSTEELHAPSHDNVHAANRIAGAIATKGLPEEMDHLVAALGLGHGVFGLARGTFTMGRKRSKDKSVDRELVRRAWIRLGELFAMNVSCNTAVTARLQTYLRALSLLGSPAKSAIHYTSDLCTMALLARCIPLPFADSRAEALWNRAKIHESKLVQPYERLVLNSITLKEAATRLRETTLPTANSPLRALATSLVLDRVREHASVLFVRTASPDEDVSGDTWAFSEQNDKRGEKDEEKRWRETISAGRSLGGQVGALVDAFAKAWQSGVLDIDGLLSSDEEGECTEIAALLNAIVLYRQVFPPSVLSCTAISAVEEESSTQSILSPPPSPSSCPSGLVRVGYDKEAVLKLRRALGSSAFDFREIEGKVLEEGAKLGETLEETRDRVVDLLVEYERRGRGRICKFNVQEH
ncbi:hypothetical protein SERLA73DRAFT_101808 [Serpula lacrymans var. lacrymans S7.3]|uniref:Uncharacterized protein n=2 Tax=Serpula lacrymans var. lacrymans TaxID=341189 RepID=F8PKN6_SERL3|nr:uncharacterized protein SERLADRAFT_457089 [Serpula lacrymans var. lacrymans S7.9]EGO03583.1 hypothetical protein SERLA73DRAFT_101808 [Serpula lacrymans var. lacrymans S7.3]EGO29401.1 hypothetical protein SERLADRAFT_457089 [Serpula lacrymans var. lacrymans S7.9]